MKEACGGRRTRNNERELGRERGDDDRRWRGNMVMSRGKEQMQQGGENEQKKHGPNPRHPSS